jgi:adenine-specific DNA glycosylase
MLTKILEICKNTPQGADLNKIARKLNKDQIVVEGMVEQLLRMGKLVEHAKYPVCKMCPTRRSCILLKSSPRRFSVPMNAVRDYNPNCLELNTSDRGSNIDSA